MFARAHAHHSCDGYCCYIGRIWGATTRRTKLKSELILLFAVKITYIITVIINEDELLLSRKYDCLVDCKRLCTHMYDTVASNGFLTSNTQSDLIKNRFTCYLCYSKRDDNTLCNDRQKANKKQTAVNSDWTKNIVQMMTTNTKVSFSSIFIKAVCFNGFVTRNSFFFSLFFRLSFDFHFNRS